MLHELEKGGFLSALSFLFEKQKGPWKTFSALFFFSSPFVREIVNNFQEHLK